MADLRIAHTADLDSASIKAALALLDDVFAGEMTDDDWEHALGGIHALVLWALRPDEAVSGLFLDGLAATTALASRLLLTAV